MGDRIDPLLRALATLEALQGRIGDAVYVGQALVAEYHRAVDHVASLDIDVAEFRIDQSLVRPWPVVTNHAGKVESWSDPEIETRIFGTKVDSLTNYVRLRIEHEGRDG